MMSRLTLRLKALLLRTFQSLFTLCDLYLSYPLPRPASFKRKIKSTVSTVPGAFNILFYTPPAYIKASSTKSSSPSYSTSPTKKHPLLVNFHGGGFTIGNAHDDARWATHVTTQTPAVVVSISYRRAPEYPFPIGIEDCVSAVIWLWRHADEYDIDISKTAFSGSSAGGNFTYAVSIRLHEELAKIENEDKALFAEIRKGKLVNLVVFYGSVDWTQSRAERDESNPKLIPVIPPDIFKLFDESYLYPKPDMNSPLLSPGIAPDDLLRDALPDSLVMINCEGDQLLAENERFRKRLMELKKNVTSMVVKGVGHGWDKRPTWGKGDIQRDNAYELAVESLKQVWLELA